MAAGAGSGREALDIVEEGRLDPGIRWLLCRAGPNLDQADFLLPEELEEGRRYRHAGRRRQWLLGRAAAKRLLLEREDLGWSPENAHRYFLRRREDGWPEVFRAGGAALALALSISHTGDWVLCALGEGRVAALGADTERIERRSGPFLEDFFSAGEREMLARLPAAETDRAVNAVWCLKEAVLKAAKSGLRRRATDVEVHSLGELGENGWNRADVRLSPEGICPAWWRVSKDGRLALALGTLQGG